MSNEIKCEAAEPSTGKHSQHNFRVNLTGPSFTVDCTKLQTVLGAIKSLSAYEKKISPEDQVILQLGRADKKTAIPTHFPCTLIEEGELVVLSTTKEKVEVVESAHDRAVLSKEQYCVFYVETIGGKNSKTIAKQRYGLFNSSAIKNFTRLCVYGPKGMTVKEALDSDGRFSNTLVKFQLSDVSETDLYTESTQTINSLHGKTFRISFERGTHAKMVAQKIPKLQAVSVKELQERGSDAERIDKLLHTTFPELRKFLQNTFQGELGKVDFEKIQQAFTDIHSMRKLIELGESVCIVYIQGDTKTGSVQGNGFVLFDNYILTNAHLLTGFIDENTLKSQVKAVFNYELENQGNSTLEAFCLDVDNTIIDFDCTLDYAVLKLHPDNINPVPPGLLKYFGPKPDNGGACIIGHIPGSVKKMDITYIIEKTKRMESAQEKLNDLKKVDPNTYMVVARRLVEKENLAILIASDDVITYDTFMYNGSSGSPVFDAEGRVVALHSAGFVYDYPESEKHGVIEFAYPLLNILKHFVTNLKARNDVGLLANIKEIYHKQNPCLGTILDEM